jgi:hypothetical protein
MPANTSCMFQVGIVKRAGTPGSRPSSSPDAMAQSASMIENGDPA